MAQTVSIYDGRKAERVLTEILNEPRDYGWGSTTLIADLQERPPSGAPEAEVWFGDHRASPARTTDGRLLSALGERPLPFLVKLLAASSPLSIQAHPTLQQAQDGYAREQAGGIPLTASNRNYKDRNHKPEMVVAVSDHFVALAGFRGLNDTRRIVDELGVGGKELLTRLTGEDDSAVLAEVMSWLFSGGAPIGDIIGAVERSPSEELRHVRDIARLYPGDVGVVVALLMNYVSLQRGEALFAPAGMLHAYLSGLGVEVMATSDNVLRGGLTPKHVDPSELVTIVSTVSGPAPILEPQGIAPGLREFDLPVADFRVLEVSPSVEEAVTIAPSGTSIIVAVGGSIDVVSADTLVELRPGRAAYATAAEDELQIRGTGVAYLACAGSQDRG